MVYNEAAARRLSYASLEIEKNPEPRIWHAKKKGGRLESEQKKEQGAERKCTVGKRVGLFMYVCAD